MSLIDLADLKSCLNIPETTTEHDVKLQMFCDAVQVPVEDLAGPVVPRTITGETHDGNSPRIYTLARPIISVTSLTEYSGVTAYPLTAQPVGSTVDQYGYQIVDAVRGVILRRDSAGMEIPFLCGRQNVVISYVAGYATLPANVRLGAIELLRHWYQFGQQGGRPGFESLSGDEGFEQVGMYAVPQFVAELLRSTPSAPLRIPSTA